MERKEFINLSHESSNETLNSEINITIDDENEEDVQNDYVSKLRSQRLKI